MCIRDRYMTTASPKNRAPMIAVRKASVRAYAVPTAKFLSEKRYTKSAVAMIWLVPAVAVKAINSQLIPGNGSVRREFKNHKYNSPNGSPKRNRTIVTDIVFSCEVRCFCAAERMFCTKAAKMVIGIHSQEKAIILGFR